MKLDHHTATSHDGEHAYEQPQTKLPGQTQEESSTKVPVQTPPGRDTSISPAIRTTIRRPFT